MYANGLCSYMASCTFSLQNFVPIPYSKMTITMTFKHTHTPVMGINFLCWRVGHFSPIKKHELHEKFVRVFQYKNIFCPNFEELQPPPTLWYKHLWLQSLHNAKVKWLSRFPWLVKTPVIKDCTYPEILTKVHSCLLSMTRLDSYHHGCCDFD